MFAKFNIFNKEQYSMTGLTIFTKEYSGEELCEVDRDVLFYTFFKPIPLKDSQ